jgi:cytochrome P450
MQPATPGLLGIFRLGAALSALPPVSDCWPPDEYLQAQLHEDPAQLPAFVEEMLRLEAPGPAIPRVTTREVNIGASIPARSVVWLA